MIDINPVFDEAKAKSMLSAFIELIDKATEIKQMVKLIEKECLDNLPNGVYVINRRTLQIHHRNGWRKIDFIPTPYYSQIASIYSAVVTEYTSLYYYTGYH